MRKSNLRFLCLAAAATLIMGGCSGSTDSGETVAVQSVSMLAGLSAGIQNRYAGKVVPLATQEIKKDDQKDGKGSLRKGRRRGNCGTGSLFL